MRLAALLHDADDRKYFDQHSTNANLIIEESVFEHTAKTQILSEALEMISYVSASSNGNQIPERAINNPELLWVRYSDRLEAIGTIGMVRCYQYNSE